MFKYFKELNKKQMLAWTIGMYALYFSLTVLAPVIVVCCKYNLFNNTVTDSRVKLSGWAIVLLMVAGIVGLTVLRKASEKIGEDHISHAIFKYTLKTIRKVLLPVIVLIAIYMMTKNFELAKETIIWMCCFYIVGGVLDGTVISVIDRENRFRAEAKHSNEVSERKDKV